MSAPIEPRHRKAARAALGAPHRNELLWAAYDDHREMRVSQALADCEAASQGERAERGELLAHKEGERSEITTLDERVAELEAALSSLASDAVTEDGDCRICDEVPPHHENCPVSPALSLLGDTEK